MDGGVYFVREAPIIRIDGDNVYFEVASGGRVFRFESSINTFLATFARFGTLASEWRAMQQYATLDGGNVTHLRR